MTQQILTDCGPLFANSRFDLIPVRKDDLLVLHDIFINPHVQKYLLDDNEVSTGFTAEAIESSLSSFSENGHGIWGAWTSNHQTLFGFCGYKHFFEPPQLQLLYGLLPEFTGKGIATEMAGIMISFGFRNLGFKEIIAAIDAPNLASERVLQKAGMKFWKRERYPEQEWDTVFYRADKSTFSAFVEFTVR